MEVIRFVLNADPDKVTRMGALIQGGTRVVDLQAAHVSMRGTPSPWFRDAATYALGEDEALAAAVRVVAWVASQQPPGTVVPASRTRIVG